MESDNNRKERERESEIDFFLFRVVVILGFILFQIIGYVYVLFVVVALLLFWWFTNFEVFFTKNFENKNFYSMARYELPQFDIGHASRYVVGWKMNGLGHSEFKAQKMCHHTRWTHSSLSQYYQKAINLRIYQNVTTLKLKQIAVSTRNKHKYPMREKI